MPSALVSLKNKIKLSPGEERLLNLLPPSGKKFSTNELAKLYYTDKQEPINSRLVIVSLIRGIQRKIERVKTPPFFVCCSERAGPYPMQVWRSRHAAPERQQAS